MGLPITFDDVLRTREKLRRYLGITPLRRYGVLDEILGCRVLVKHENHQPTNSFKVRNGLAAVLALSDEQQRRGVVAATRGNHGLGVAWAGKELGAAVTICVPVGNNPEKNEAMAALGAELIERGETYDESVAVMEQLVAERGLTAVHSTNNLAVVAGAGTMTLEILEQAEAMGEKIDAMVFAIGGGSQAVGAMTVVRELRPEVAVYGAQAEPRNATWETWRAGRAIEKRAGKTIADGVATGKAYEVTFGALREGLADFVLVSEEEIAEAIRVVLRATHNLVEGAGAIGVSAAGKMRERFGGKTVAVVLSGGNIDVGTLRQVVCGT